MEDSLEVDHGVRHRPSACQNNSVGRERPISAEPAGLTARGPSALTKDTFMGIGGRSRNRMIVHCPSQPSGQKKPGLRKVGKENVKTSGAGGGGCWGWTGAWTSVEVTIDSEHWPTVLMSQHKTAARNGVRCSPDTCYYDFGPREHHHLKTARVLHPRQTTSWLASSKPPDVRGGVAVKTPAATKRRLGRRTCVMTLKPQMARPPDRLTYWGGSDTPARRFLHANPSRSMMRPSMFSVPQASTALATENLTLQKCNGDP